MIQRLSRQLPEWARPNHPAIRHTLGPPSRRKRQGILIQFIAGLLILVLVGVIGGSVFGQSVALPLSEIVLNALFWPTLALQQLLGILVMVYASGIVAEEKRRQTWDTLRTTRSGIGLAMRARWSAAIFYRLAGFVATLFVARLLLLAMLLYDVTAFSGDYLAIVSGGQVIPQLPLAVVIVLLALSIAASFVLPLTGLGLDAAVGLLLGTFIHQRVFLVLAQVILGVARVGVTGGVIALLLYTTDINTMPSTAAAWLSMVAYGAFGDLGLRYLNLAFYSELWAVVKFGIFVGVGLLIAAFLQALLSDVLVALAVRRAETRE